ncbi:BioY protein [Ignisphaera aggregans DSM 17230]|uniref:BioY protein n=1 Tax=Ignisphaera aggregans (strain DSM 17230 / JCM 13409 / AQ1.S1) TaxID=583356 RepID=E0SNI3_IGNAA|nr:BioY protein [Ignisphaera aggregans DSM 17230]
MSFSIVAMAIGSWISFYVGPIPYTFQNLGVVLTGLLLPPRYSFSAIGLYLLLIAIGMPIAAGFRGGIHVLYGYTAGYLWGFLLSAPLLSLVSRRYLKAVGKSLGDIDRKNVAILLALVSIAMIPTYILGVAVLYIYIFKLPTLYRWAEAISLYIGIPNISPIAMSFIVGMLVFLPQDIFMDHLIAILVAREIYRYLYRRGIAVG